MKLYELSEVFNALFENFDEMAESENFNEDMQTAWFDTLDGIEQEFEIKAESLAVYIKGLVADVKQLKAEEQSLKARRQSKEKQVESLKLYLLNNMQAINLKKIDMPKAVLSVRNNPESVEINSESEFVKWAMVNDDSMLKYLEPEIRKTVVKSALKNGVNIPFAKLVKTQSIIIK